MGKRELPEGANALWRWMAQQRVTLDELAARVETSPAYIGQLRRGEGRPSDAMKLKIAQATLAFEAEQGIANPVGVPPTAWFEEAVPS